MFQEKYSVAVGENSITYMYNVTEEVSEREKLCSNSNSHNLGIFSDP